MEEPRLEAIKLRDCSEGRRKELLERSGRDVKEIMPKVERIIEEVKERGTKALLKFTEKFDGVAIAPKKIQATEEDISRAYDKMEERDVEAIKSAASSIERYHEKQLPEEWMEEFEHGIKAGQIVRPLKSIGAYVPGGRAKYPTTVLMAIIPAKIAGVERTVVCTPPNPEGNINAATLVAADVAGTDEIYKAGGAQAIAAMAYGTETIHPVEKIVGPGNVYVSAAKKIVSSEVDIDFMAGPTEVLILSDSSADAKIVATDIVAQSEHDPSSASILATTSEELAEKVIKNVESILESTPRSKIAGEALQKYGKILVLQDLEEGIDFVNQYAPEHLQIMTENPERELERIENAGAIFLGKYSPTSAGDFGAGPNHILPTGGDARRYDGLSVLDFVRMPTVQKLTKKGLGKLSEVINRLAEIEDLPAHNQSVKERLKEAKNDD